MEELSEFELDCVEETGKELGRGSYGVVTELRVGRLLCAGKTLHGSFFETNDSGSGNILERFIKECRQHGKLKHPHILQVLGVHLPRGSHVPVLVMEKMFISLSKCLEQYPVIPPRMKYRILLDASLGLDHLHSQDIVHRDLSANNILLSEAMRAKIADLGVARIINVAPSQLTNLTQAPGTPPYMAPEALVDRPKYSTELDIFSFGILILHTVIQKLPIPNSAAATPDPKKIGNFLHLTEEQRRVDHFKQMGDDHPLKSLVVECIHNDYRCRPKILGVVTKLEELVLNTPSEFANTLQIYLKLAEKEETIEQLKMQLEIIDKKLIEAADCLDRAGTEKEQVKEKVCEISEHARSAIEGRRIVGQGASGLVVAYRPSSSLASSKEVLKVQQDQAKGVPLSLIICPPVSMGFTGTFVRSFNAGLRNPIGVAFSSAEEVMVVDYKGEEGLHVFNTSGEKVRSFVTAARHLERSMPAEKCYYPHGVTCSNDAIYLVDRWTHRVLQFDMNGELKAVAGLFKAGSGQQMFDHPAGIAISNKHEVYVCDKDNHRVKVLSMNLKFRTEFGSLGKQANHFEHPIDVAFDSHGNVFVVDCSNFCVKVFSPGPEHRYLRQIGKEGGQTWNFRCPVSIAIDRNDYIYVVDSHKHAVMVFNHGGEFMMLFGTYGTEEGQFYTPRGIAINSDGLVCVSDYENHRVQLFQ